MVIPDSYSNSCIVWLIMHQSVVRALLTALREKKTWDKINCFVFLSQFYSQYRKSDRPPFLVMCYSVISVTCCVLNRVTQSNFWNVNKTQNCHWTLIQILIDSLEVEIEISRNSCLSQILWKDSISHFSKSHKKYSNDKAASFSCRNHNACPLGALNVIRWYYYRGWKSTGRSSNRWSA